MSVIAILSRREPSLSADWIGYQKSAPDSLNRVGGEKTASAHP
jgi:hypothetical protein